MKQLTFTVPTISHALFHVAKQTPLASMPKKRMLNQLRNFENLNAFTFQSTLKYKECMNPLCSVWDEAAWLVKAHPAAERGIIISTAKKNIRRVAHTESYFLLFSMEINME